MKHLKDLELLVQSRYPLIAAETQEEDRLEQVLQMVSEKVSAPFFEWTVTSGLGKVGADNRMYDTKHPIKALSNIGAMQGGGIFLFKDLHNYFDQPEVVRKLRDMASDSSKHRSIIISGFHITLPAELQNFAATYSLALPSKKELIQHAEKVVKGLAKEHSFKMELTADEFDRLVDSMRGFTFFEVEKALTRAVLHDLALTSDDINLITDIKKELLDKHGVLEYSPPDEDMVSVGGLGNLKQWLDKRSKALTKEAFEFGIEPPKGVLLLGVQGCGKSLVAKTIASEWKLPLLKLEASRLYDKFIGESEKNLDQALKLAERMAPTVLMIDEIEKGFSQDSSGGDGGVSKRLLGRFLTWLQDKKDLVFVVATCNDITSLPPELTRKGRFDEIFFIDLPSATEREDILAVHIRARERDPSTFDLSELALAADGYSGAELEQAVVSALYTAFSSGSDLSTDHILQEIQATRPLSITRAEDVQSLRQWASERAVSAS